MKNVVQNLVVILAGASLAACGRPSATNSNDASGYSPIVSGTRTAADEARDRDYERDQEIQDQRELAANRAKVREALHRYSFIKRRDVRFDGGNVAILQEKTSKVMCDDPNGRSTADSVPTITCEKLNAERAQTAHEIAGAYTKFGIPRGKYVIETITHGQPQCAYAGEGETADCKSMMAYDRFMAKASICMSGGLKGIEWSINGGGNIFEAKVTKNYKADYREARIQYDFDHKTVSTDTMLEPTVRIRGNAVYDGNQLLGRLPIASNVFQCPAPKKAPVVQ